MTVIRGEQSRNYIAEDDPLPPEDAAPKDHRPSIDQLYRDTRPRLLRFLGRRNGAQDADDLVQQSFVRMLAIQSPGAPRIRRSDSYLFRVARNLTIDRAKSAGRRLETDQMSIESAELAAPEQLEALDQIAALEARDMLRRLEFVINGMKPRTREIFLAHRIDGYSYGEIAARTGLSIKGVEKQMCKAIATIDRSMKHR